MKSKLLSQQNCCIFSELTFAQKIFTVFLRLHTKNANEGTDKGLTICKKIVQNHNGFIEAFSAPNNETAFEIYFPDL